jgi:hypothetical protein
MARIGPAVVAEAVESDLLSAKSFYAVESTATAQICKLRIQTPQEHSRLRLAVPVAAYFL